MRRAGCVWALAASSIASVTALAADGDFDPSWGNGGRLQVDVTSPGNDQGRTLLIQRDGKLLMAGTCPYGTETSFCATRQLADGSFDTSFGPASHPGRVITREGQNFSVPVKLAASALTADGGSVYAGDMLTSNPSRTGQVVKLNAAGAYVGQGFVGSTDLSSAFGVAAIAVQPDGMIVVAGGVFAGGTSYFSIQRLLADFSDLDHSFGDNGTKLFVFDGEVDSHPTALALQADGKIVVAGIVDTKVGVARLLANGQLDDDLVSGFGDGGRATFDWGLPSGANAIVVDRNGNLLLAGYAYNSAALNPNIDFFVNRLTPFGHQDPTFNLSFIGLPRPAYIDFNFGDSNYDEARAVAIQSDGKILVSGLALRIGDVQYFSVARLTRFGHPDPSFGSGGQIRGQYNRDAPIRNDTASAIAIGNGGIMVAGYSQEASGPNYRFGIAKLQLDLIFSSAFE